MSDSEHSLLIGVDGGGTRCRAAIGTLADGVIAQAEGGRANAASDPDLAIKNIIATVKAAAQKAGVTAAQLASARAHLGLAGIMTSKDSARIACALPYKDVVVTDDRPTAVRGALGKQNGYLLSVGTGTITAAQTEGKFRSVGGWGFHLSDQASGAWLGRAGLRQAMLCHDGLAEHTDLTRALIAKFNNDPNAMVSFSMAAHPGDYGALAPDIVAAAAAKDPWAQSVMKTGADYLVRSLTALSFLPGDTICLTGGVGPQYVDFLPREVLAGQIECHGSALDGAFQLAGMALTRQSEVKA